MQEQERLEAALIDLAVDSWRMSRLCARAISKLDAGEAGRYANQLRYFQNRLDTTLSVAGVKLVNIEGQPFEPGMAAAPLNLGDFDATDALVVDQVVEPIVMGSDGLKRQGTVMLRKVHP